MTLLAIPTSLLWTLFYGLLLYFIFLLRMDGLSGTGGGNSGGALNVRAAAASWPWSRFDYFDRDGRGRSWDCGGGWVCTTQNPGVSSTSLFKAGAASLGEELEEER